MTVEQIVAALQAIVAEATDGADPDPNSQNSAPQLNEDQAARYEALEAKLVVARKSEEIIKRNAAYTAVTAPVVTMGNRKETDEYSRAFDAFLRTGKVNSDLIQRAQSEGTGSAGGFLVPTTFQAKITEHLKAYGGLLNEAEKLSTATGESIVWVTQDDVLSNEAAVTPENALWSTGADLVFGTRMLGAYKYTTVGASNLPLKVSYELLQDSQFDVQAFIARKFAERIGRKLAVDLINGSGVNEPQGLLNGSLTNSGVTLASATAPTYAELLTIVHSLDPAYRDGAKWLMSDATMAAIEGVVDGSGRPLLWNSSNDMSQGSGMTLLGYPVVIDQAMPALTGSTKVLVFGNLKNAFIVREIKGFTMVTLSELYAQNGQVGFMGWGRWDSLVQDPFSAVYATSHS